MIFNLFLYLKKSLKYYFLKVFYFIINNISILGDIFKIFEDFMEKIKIYIDNEIYNLY